GRRGFGGDRGAVRVDDFRSRLTSLLQKQKPAVPAYSEAMVTRIAKRRPGRGAAHSGHGCPRPASRPWMADRAGKQRTAQGDAPAEAIGTRLRAPPNRRQ